MLKPVVGLLVLVNLGLLAAHWGLLGSGIARSGSAAQREPDRLAQQIKVPQVKLFKADGSALDSPSGVAAPGTAGSAGSASTASAAAVSTPATQPTPSAEPGAASAVAGALAASAAEPAVATASAPTLLSAASAVATPANALSAAAASMAPASTGGASAGLPASAQGSAASALACVEAGPFDASSVKTAEQTLRQAGLAAGSWVARDADPGARFMIHMGPYANREALQRKHDEIKRLGLAAEEVQGNPTLQPGLNLGRFESQASADAALAALVKRGVHTAQVVALTQSLRHTLLRVPAADPALRQRLARLALPGGRPFTTCTEWLRRITVTPLPLPAAAASALR